jgi:hypothetical protein
VAIVTGTVVTSTDPTGGPSAWTPTNTPYSVGPQGVSCTADGLCIVVDDEGQATVSTSPTAGAGAWSTHQIDPIGPPVTAISCAAAALCVAVDGNNAVLSAPGPTADPSQWHKTVIGSADLSGVSCPTRGFCAAGAGGDVLISTNAGATTPQWSSTQVDPGGQLVDIACPSVDLCVAIDDEGNAITSTDPASPGAQWSIAPVGGNLDSHISCPTTTLCLISAGFELIASSDPAGGASAWSAYHPPFGNYLNGASCSPGGVCAAVDDAGNVLTSADPAAASPTWTSQDVDGTTSIQAVSCPGDCVALDTFGHVLTSASPQAAGSWTVSPSSVDYNQAYVLACQAGGTCLAGDEIGRVLLGTRPALALPQAGSVTASAIGTSQADLHATVDAEGLAITDCRLEYGPSATYGFSAPCDPISLPLAGASAVSTDLFGLAPNTTYHARVVVTNGLGVNAGADSTFTTAAVPQPPNVTTGSGGVEAAATSTTAAPVGEPSIVRWSLVRGATTLLLVRVPAQGNVRIAELPSLRDGAPVLHLPRDDAAAAAGTLTIHVQLTATGLRLWRHAHRLDLRLAVTFTGRDNRTQRVIPLVHLERG